MCGRVEAVSSIRGICSTTLYTYHLYTSSKYSDSQYKTQISLLKKQLIHIDFELMEPRYIKYKWQWL